MDMDMDGKFHIHGKPGKCRSFYTNLALADGQRTDYITIPPTRNVQLTWTCSLL